MNKNKMRSFIIFLPFAFAIGSFVLFIRCYLKLKTASGEIAMILTSSMTRYRNMCIFCLIVGFILLLIKSIYEYIEIKNNISIYEQDGILDKISTRRFNNELVVNNIAVSEAKLTNIDEETIINDLLVGRKLNVKFVGTNIKEKLYRFNGYNEKSNTIELSVVKNANEPIKKEYILSRLNKDGFKKCSVCNNLLASDAKTCVHCGTLLEKEEKKSTSLFNPVKFVLNIIVILLCIILILLVVNKISDQTEINRDNLNIKTVETK